MIAPKLLLSVERALASARGLYHRARDRGIPMAALDPLVGLGKELKETIDEMAFLEARIEKDAVLYRVHLVTKDIARWASKAKLGPFDEFEDFKAPPLLVPKGGWEVEAELSNRCRFKCLRTSYPAKALAAEVIAGGEGRARASQALADAICKASGLPVTRVRVIERPRAHTLQQGKLATELHGDYRPTSDEPPVIRIFNRTARKAQEVAGKTFLDTLVHELCHHADFRILGLRLSPHCEGFYARVAHTVRSLRGIPTTERPESYAASAGRRR